MNQQQYKKMREEQARVIGECTIIGAYTKTTNRAADKAYVIEKLDRIALLTRRMDSERIGSIENWLEDRDAVERIGLGYTFCAKALAFSLTTLHTLAKEVGCDRDKEVQEAVKRLRSSRKVLIRREIEGAVQAIERTAAAKGCHVADLDMCEDLIDTLATTIEEGDRMGLSKSFIRRMMERIGR